MIHSIGETPCYRDKSGNQIWVDSSFIRKNPDIFEPMPGISLCAYVERCNTEFKCKFDNSHFTLDKKVGSFRFVIDSLGRFDHSYARVSGKGDVALAEFNQLIPQSIVFKKQYWNSELAGIYTVDSSGKIQYFGIQFQKRINDLAPMFEVKQTTDSAVNIANRSILKAKPILYGSLNKLIEIRNEYDAAQDHSELKAQFAISSSGSVYFVKIISSSDNCSERDRKYIEVLKNLAFDQVQFGVSNAMVTIQLLNSSATINQLVIFPLIKNYELVPLQNQNPIK